MDIVELEWIRDFCDHLENLRSDSLNLACFLEESQPQDIHFQFASCISNQADLIQKYFLSFKEKIDRKYHDVWKAKYPHISNLYLSEQDCKLKFKDTLKENVFNSRDGD